MRYLLDTNILSEPTKPDPHPRLLAKLSRHRTDLFTAAPVWNELVFGVRRLPASKKRRRLERYLRDVVAASIVILPYDSRAAEWHADERARLAKLGQTPAFVDGQIAAIAHVVGLVLVTHNTAHFTPFRDLEIEDWMDGVEPAERSQD